MESKEEEEIARRWKAEVAMEEKEQGEKDEKGRRRMVEGGKGRREMRRIGGVELDVDVVEIPEGEDEDEEDEEEMTVTVGRKRKGRG